MMLIFSQNKEKAANSRLLSHGTQNLINHLNIYIFCCGYFRVRKCDLGQENFKLATESSVPSWLDICIGFYFVYKNLRTSRAQKHQQDFELGKFLCSSIIFLLLINNLILLFCRLTFFLAN